MVNDYQENYYTGYVSVYRSVLNNPFWLSEKFTRGQAWVDLLLLAKYKDGFFYKRDIMVNYKRGDVTEGIINLSKRWKWSRNKTQKFINDLEKEQQVKQHRSHVITIISVCNYNVYQTKKTTDETTIDTTAGQQQDTHNKDNKDNNVYTEVDFLQNWEIARKHYLNKPTFIKKLDALEKVVFDRLVKEYTKEEINEGVVGLFKQKDKSITSMFLKPKHFLDNFIKYYNAEKSKDYELYGKGKQKTEL